MIDAAHANPGEILDTLMVLPFLSDDAVVVYHDVNLHTGSGVYKMCNNESGYTNNLLMSALYGTKILQGNFNKEGCFSKAADVFPCFPNIGAVKITTETKNRFFEIFNLLTLKWSYLPSVIEENEIIHFFTKYYPEYFIEYLKEVFLYQRECYEHEKLNSVYKRFKKIIRLIFGDQIINTLVRIKK